MEMAETEQQTLVIRIDGGLGRVVAMSGAITEVAKKRPVRVITSRPLVFWGNQYIKSVHGLDDRRLFDDVIRSNDYIELEPYTDPEFGERETTIDRIDVNGNYCKDNCKWSTYLEQNRNRTISKNFIH